MSDDAVQQVSDTMQHGNYVLMRKLTGVKPTLARLRKGATICVDNLTFKPDPVLGKKFGVYTAQNGQLGPDEADVDKELAKIRELSKGENDEGDVNQVNLVKDKVQLKKANKAQSAILVEKINTRLLAEFYYFRNPETVGYFRPDSAAQILHNSGIKAGERVLIYDQCFGIMTTYVVERLGGQGTCVCIHNGASASNITCFHNRQFSKEVKDTLITLPLKMLVNTEEEKMDYNDVENGEKPVETVKEEKVLDEEAKKKQEEAMIRAAEKKARQEEAVTWFDGDIPNFGRYDSLLVICKNVSPVSVLDLTFKAVRTSGTVVVYSPFEEEMVKTKAYLDDKNCVLTEIRSTKVREIQVLPKRTHPLMQQLVVGGYYLSTVKGYDPTLKV
ncbi:unnamed protein product [Bursaphelenchus okinawaensis]|uniref:tRNA (adenine(58)-N(1))-methyltransferase non-catalytic subunit TRM6 n=1 Tax=Bursaphelenchus okinawaensis TaxID=465554 RepID=A0A811L717_9BILA|nr:unnamed protein product [Bursaphelenchus okinawaensis]CAG9118051.1 unnamed protein product [Bursaphelenchus okinawaensis]